MSLIGVNCSGPPERPSSGTFEWNGDYAYKSKITYTCGPYGKFQGKDGKAYKDFTSVCAWNKTWVPQVLDQCVGKLHSLVILNNKM